MKVNAIGFFDSDELEIERVYLRPTLTSRESHVVAKSCAVKVRRTSKGASCEINFSVEVDVVKTDLLCKIRVAKIDALPEPGLREVCGASELGPVEVCGFGEVRLAKAHVAVEDRIDEVCFSAEFSPRKPLLFRKPNAPEIEILVRKLFLNCFPEQGDVLLARKMKHTVTVPIELAKQRFVSARGSGAMRAGVDKALLRDCSVVW